MNTLIETYVGSNILNKFTCFLLLLLLLLNACSMGSSQEVAKYRSTIILFDDGKGNFTAQGRIGMHEGRSTWDQPASIWLIGEGGISWDGRKLAEGGKYIVDKKGNPKELSKNAFRVFKYAETETHIFERKGGKGKVLATVKPGQKLEIIIPSKGKWDKVAINDNIIGWVSSNVLEKLTFVEEP